MLRQIIYICHTHVLGIEQRFEKKDWKIKGTVLLIQRSAIRLLAFYSHLIYLEGPNQMMTPSWLVCMSRSLCFPHDATVFKRFTCCQTK